MEILIGIGLVVVSFVAGLFVGVEAGIKAVMNLKKKEVL